MNSNKPTANRYIKNFRLLSLLLSICMLVILPAISKTSLAAVPHVLQKQTNYFCPSQLTPDKRFTGWDKDMTKGYWSSRQSSDRYCIEFRADDEEFSHWNMSRCFMKTGFQKTQNDVYHLSRETGTLTLKGTLEKTEGEGTYEFTEDSSFKKYLADNKISNRDENFLFHLYMADMNKEYIVFLKKNYTQIPGDRLLELAIHGISLKNYQAYIELFEKHNKQKPSLQDVIAAKIHGINKQYIEQLYAIGFTDLNMQKMMEAKIHGVDAEFIDVLKKAGYTGLSIDKIISAKIHGLSSKSIEQIQSLGYKDLSLDKMIEAKIHGVNAAYIKDLEQAGFANLPIDKLISAKIHGVDGEFIDKAKNKGYKLEDIGEYINLKIHGLTRNDN